MSDQNEQNISINELHYIEKTTNPSWSDASQTLNQRLALERRSYDELERKWKQEYEERKTLLEVYKRDLRLGNLNADEVAKANIYLNIATDSLTEGYSESFRIAISRVASYIELSQSREGFFRKQQNSIFMETKTENVEPKKKGVFNSIK